MSISSITSSYQALLAQQNAAKSSQSSSSSSSSGATSDILAANSPQQTFMDYMKKTPAQRMETQWLTSHNITEQQFQAMPAAQKQAIENQMATAIKGELKQKATQTMESQKMAL